MVGRSMELNDLRATALQTLMDGSFSVSLNMNDTFGFACSDCENMSWEDFEKMVPIIAEHGRAALTAYVAVKRGAEPIHCSCGHDGPQYRAARVQVEALKATEPYFMED